MTRRKLKFFTILVISGSFISIAAILKIVREAIIKEHGGSIGYIRRNTSERVNVRFLVNNSALALLINNNTTTVKERSYNGNFVIFNTTLLIERAARLRQEAEEIRRYNSENSSQTKSHRIHLFTYASDAWNMTLQRFVLGAERSEMYTTIHPFTPNELERIDPEFVNEFQEILSLSRGGGYWLWKFPLLEYMLRITPSQDYIFYIDSGSSILSSGKEVLDSWLDSLESNEKEILRFHYSGAKYNDSMWCVTNIFQAFNISCLDPKSYKFCESTQLPATGFIGRNGADLRDMLALIYDALSQDPWMITDVYNRKTKRQWKRMGRWWRDNRHDQCLLSLASKVLDNYRSLDVPENTGLHIPRNRVFQFSRIKGQGGEDWAQMDLKSFTVWRTLCFPRNRSEDMFCDSLSLALRYHDSASGVFANILKSWNKSTNLYI